VQTQDQLSVRRIAEVLKRRRKFEMEARYDYWDQI